MIIILNSIDDKPNMTTTMFVNTNIILIAMHILLIEKDARFKVL